MTDRILVDLSKDGRIAVEFLLEGHLPQRLPFRDLAWPLDGDALEDLRWYLEDYLLTPFGVYEDRGGRVAGALAGWGHAVFGQVFGNDPARDAYHHAMARQGPVEIVFRSDSPALLGLPWELMTDPDRPQEPLAVHLAGLNRSLPVCGPAEAVPAPEGRLRVLMVISRPDGTHDVRYRMIARPLLDRLEAVRGQVDLVVLRPPTLDALRRALAEAAADGRPFQVVHFDGHGVPASHHAPGTGASSPLAAHAVEGSLAFEHPDGGKLPVPASRVAQVLAEANVPVAVLNACHSGTVASGLEAAVATCLLREGVAAVVAMAYSIDTGAAAEFMVAFYERLFAGDTISAAVTAGRRRLYQQDKRPSLKGQVPLADWLVPVHYLRRDVSFPQARTQRTRQSPPLDGHLDEAARPGAQAAGIGDLEAVGAFIGRDDLFCQLEAAARVQRVVVLHGPGGSGKTELAKAFGRWWRDTAGVDQPDWVFWHSFEPGAAASGLDGVISEIGLRVFGTGFAGLDAAERETRVRKFLAASRALLIWDNFETVCSMPDLASATVPLDEAARARVAEFLRQAVGLGRSTVLITSRSPEAWLGDCCRLAVGGLASDEAAQYADSLLAHCPAAAPRRARRAFGELMEWLDGNPLAMRLTLPRLETADPETLLSGLRGTPPLPEVPGEPTGRTRSLAASIGYSFAHLAEPTRRLLAAVSLFQAVADEAVLRYFSEEADVPPRFQGASGRDWKEAMDDAARVGLLTSLGHGMHRIHPALPSYLAARWRDEEPAAYGAERNAAMRALAAAQAVQGKWLGEQIGSGDVSLAYSVIGLERGTLGALLGYALEHGLWDQAEGTFLLLCGYWWRRGLVEEARALADRARIAAEAPDGALPPLDAPAGRIWVISAEMQAACQAARLRFDDAERICRHVIAAIQAYPDYQALKHNRSLAACYDGLGMVAQARGRTGEAAKWHQKALAIREEFGDRAGIAASYRCLGQVADIEGRRGEAEERLRESLAINSELGRQADMASGYAALGGAIQSRGRLKEAEECYLKALGIYNEAGDPGAAARVCHSLSEAARLGKHLNEAQAWCVLALATGEKLGYGVDKAGLYHQLGVIAQLGGHPDEARDWYLKALAIHEELGYKPSIAITCYQLGIAAGIQRRLKEAERWWRRSMTIHEELGNVPGMIFTSVHLALAALGRGHLPRAFWHAARCVALSARSGIRPRERLWGVSPPTPGNWVKKEQVSVARNGHQPGHRHQL